MSLSCLFFHGLTLQEVVLQRFCYITLASPHGFMLIASIVVDINAKKCSSCLMGYSKEKKLRVSDRNLLRWKTLLPLNTILFICVWEV